MHGAVAAVQEMLDFARASAAAGAPGLESAARDINAVARDAAPFAMAEGTAILNMVSSSPLGAAEQREILKTVRAKATIIGSKGSPRPAHPAPAAPAPQEPPASQCTTPVRPSSQAAVPDAAGAESLGSDSNSPPERAGPRQPPHVPHKNQSCLYFHRFMTAQMWETFRNPAMGWPEALRELVQRMDELGLVSPDEPTKRRLWCVCQVARHPPGVKFAADPSEALRKKQDITGEIAALKARNKQFSLAHCGAIKTYPSSPDELRRLYPASWAEAYKDGLQPCMCPVSELMIDRVSASLPCRGSRRSVRGDPVSFSRRGTFGNRIAGAINGAMCGSRAFEPPTIQIFDRPRCAETQIAPFGSTRGYDAQHQTHQYQPQHQPQGQHQPQPPGQLALPAPPARSGGDAGLARVAWFGVPCAAALMQKTLEQGRGKRGPVKPLLYNGYKIYTAHNADKWRVFKQGQARLCGFAGGLRHGRGRGRSGPPPACAGEGESGGVRRGGEPADWREFRARLVLREVPPERRGGAGWVHEASLIEQGSLLLASAGAAFELDQQYFHKAVVLLVQHGDDGDVGLVLNRPTAFTADSLGLTCGAGAPGWNVWFGGPSQGAGCEARHQRLFCLHTLDALADLSCSVIPGVFLIDVGRATQLVADGEAEADEFMLLWGCCVWGPGQLQRELDQGDSWTLAAAEQSAFLGQLRDVQASLRAMLDERPFSFVDEVLRSAAAEAPAVSLEDLGNGVREWQRLYAALGTQFEILSESEGGGAPSHGDEMLNAWTRRCLLQGPAAGAEPARARAALAGRQRRTGALLRGSCTAWLLGGPLSEAGRPLRRPLGFSPATYMHKAVLMLLREAREGQQAVLALLNGPRVSADAFFGGTSKVGGSDVLRVEQGETSFPLLRGVVVLAPGVLEELLAAGALEPSDASVQEVLDADIEARWAVAGGTVGSLAEARLAAAGDVQLRAWYGRFLQSSLGEDGQQRADTTLLALGQGLPMQVRSTKQGFLGHYERPGEYAFQVGDIVVHRGHGQVGVVAERFDVCQLGDEWHRANAPEGMTQGQPFYTILVDLPGRPFERHGAQSSHRRWEPAL
ncbi:unnamed protein product, partial [Prorocentrum cordatum]